VRTHVAITVMVACLGTGVWAQSARPATSGHPWTMPRTPAGTPDFQGATWNFATMTPLVRPAGIDKPVLTESEAATFEKQFSERQTATTNNGYDWWDGGAAHLDHRRSSLIIDPADGQVPPLTVDAQRRAAARRRPTGTTDGPEDFALNTRCIQFQNGAMVIAAPQEFTFRDPSGYCATGTAPTPVTTPVVDLSASMIMIPYYALNLTMTNGMMIYQLNAVAALYVNNVMIAQSAPMPFSVRW